MRSLRQTAAELGVSLAEAERLRAELEPPGDLPRMAEILGMGVEELTALRLGVPSFYCYLRGLVQMPPEPSHE